VKPDVIVPDHEGAPAGVHRKLVIKQELRRLC
jgi:hypothetical protein